jgi:hypothetical protein
MKYPLTLAALLLLPLPAFAAHDYDDLPPDLARAAYAFDAAQVQGDGKALKALLADDYKLGNSAGKIEDKSQFIADYTDPDFKLLPFTLKAPVHIVWEQGAVLGGEVDYRYRMKGKPGGTYFRFADIWARRHGRWQVVYTEVTRIPRPR